MNANRIHPLLFSLVVSFFSIASASSARAAPADCAAPRGIEQQRACKAAAEGAESLRRFADRTRGLYHVYVYDYDKAIVATAAPRTSDEVKVAVRR
jgi:hypothetical protein